MPFPLVKIAVASFIIAVVAAGLGYAFGWFDGNEAGIASEKSRLTPIIVALEEEKAEARRQADAERGKSRIIAERLASEAEAARAELEETRKRAANEIARLTSASRACMSARAVRVLNNATSARRVDPPGAPAGRVDAPDAAATADPGGLDDGAASERAIAGALIEARSGYEECRGRLHRLQDWVAAITAH